MGKRVARAGWVICFALGSVANVACGTRDRHGGGKAEHAGGEGGAPQSPPESAASGLGGSEGGSSGAEAQGGSAGSAPELDAASCEPADPNLGDAGELLYSAGAPCDAVGRGLFAAGERLYWLYDRGGKSFIAAGDLLGGSSEILVESNEPIGAFDVQGVIAYQIGKRLFALPLSVPPGEPIELAETPRPCAGLTSTTAHVYCRTEPAEDAASSDVVRVPVAGGELENGFRTHIGDQLAVDDDGTVYVVESLGELNGLSYGALLGVPFHYTPPPPDPFGPHKPPPDFPFDPIEIEPNLGFKSFGLRGLKMTAHGLVFLDSTQDGQGRFGVGLGRTPMPDNVSSYAIQAAVFRGTTVSAVVAIDGPEAGDRLTAAEPELAQFEFHSAAPVVAMASAEEHVFWLDRSARIYGGSAQPPDFGKHDNFRSSLDETPIAQLTLDQVQTVCREIADYAPSDDEFRNYNCLSRGIYGVPSEFDSCDSFVEYCTDHPEERLGVDGPQFGEQDCVRELTSFIQCKLTVQEYSSCRVAYADELRHVLPQMQCGVDPASIDGQGGALPACRYLPRWCSFF